MTSNAIEFIRSGRFRVTSATAGRGWSTRTNWVRSVTQSTLSRRPAGRSEATGGQTLLRRLTVTLRGDRGVDVEVLDFLDQFLECRWRQGTGLVEHQLALLERHQRRNRPDLSLGGQFLFGLGVDLGEDHVGMLLRGGLEGRRKRTARSAPRCPEIDQHDLVVIDGVMKLLGCDVLRAHASPNVGVQRPVPSLWS